ncbi:FkbM family methyltransferase [Nocardioides sp.]|uniref:FkbM family methyltransferase n=1 Tax=Nocardioides sp. TaxID=35761 RepID=UPI00271DEB9E|nr:FkbM family methyltransferase [Nocardioides sp.]MDO9457172.1 FkbM family methyltransferase [Nocardioides sp.]
MSPQPSGDPEIPGYERRRVDDDSWLFVRDGVRRRVRRLGPPEQLATIVFEPGLARRRQGRFERGVASFLAAQHTAWLLRELRVDVVLDVGANIGQFAKHARRMGYRGRIVSFEPVPDLVEVLEQAAADDPDWHVVPCALGDEDGTAEINWSPGTLSSLLPASEFGRQWNDSLDQTTTREITIRRLADVWDEVLAGLDTPRPFLKMDTQGFDVETFRGAGDRVGQLYGLQSEVAMVPIYDGMPRFIDQLALYESAGFETTGMFPVNRDRDTLRAIEFDLMMVGPAGLAERLPGPTPATTLPS